MPVHKQQINLKWLRLILNSYFVEIVNYEFDRIDLLCLAISSALGVWYLWKKVSTWLYM